ncbi:MAG: flagellar M-ring protein FliF [Planctomycetaceae bacterium]|nr:MAG: flagellar M-ring protein FliF [Planctomycetaceae bacterium]
MTLVQRATLLGILLACGGATVLLVNWARTPDMAMMYTGLSMEEAANVVEKVREAGSPYEIRSGGTAVYVPSDKVYSLRLTMASQGLPKGDQAGYKILDEEKIGISPFSQRINYMRAVEGELAKTIQLLEGVMSARVHIVRPEEGLFAGREKQSSATVVLRVKPGWRLTNGNVAAIVHLLSGSVEGLTPQKVVVVDSQGTLLSNQTEDALAKSAGTFLDYKSRVEDYLSRKAEDMLAAALGPGRATVKIDATIDTSALDSTTEKYDPETKVIHKEETRTVATSGPADTINEYMVSRTTERKSEAAGKVTALSVAAFVDLSAPAADASADKTAPAAATPKITVKDAEEIIRNAIGMKETDQLKVVDTPFHKSAVAKDTSADDDKQSSREFYLEIARRASLGVLVIGAILALRMFRGTRRKDGAALPAGTGAPALEGSSGGGMAALTGEGENPEMLRSRITRALQENPDEVKRLFLSWVESDKRGA